MVEYWKSATGAFIKNLTLMKAWLGLLLQWFYGCKFQRLNVN